MPGRWLQRTWQHDPTLLAPPKYRRACRYDAFVPDQLMGMDIHLDGALAGLVSDAEHAIRVLNDAGAPALAPLARLLLRTESIASSKVEGMQMDVRQLARAEAREDSGMRAGPSAQEILANIDAMVLAMEEAAVVDSLGLAEIVGIHKRLMERAANRHVAGRVRTRQNWIGGNDYNPCGADFVPPPPDYVARLLEDLIAAIADDRLPPLVQAALVHAQFETIHPFDDGNGRAGRALVHVVLRRRGLAPRYLPPISVVLAAAKDRYIAGLTRYREADVSGWIEHVAATAARAAHLAAAYLRAVADLTVRWRDQLASSAVAPRAGAAAWAVIDTLPAHPIITVPVATAVTARAKSAVYQAFEQLEAAGVLVPISHSRRNQAWEVAGLFDLIEGLESGELPPG